MDKLSMPSRPSGFVTETLTQPILHNNNANDLYPISGKKGQKIFTQNISVSLAWRLIAQKPD